MRFRLGPGKPWQDGQPTAFQRSMPGFEVEQEPTLLTHLPCIVCAAQSDADPICPACRAEVPGFARTSIDEWIMHDGDVLRSERQREEIWRPEQGRDHLRAGSYVRECRAVDLERGPGPSARAVAEDRRRRLLDARRVAANADEGRPVAGDRPPRRPGGVQDRRGTGRSHGSGAAMTPLLDGDHAG